MTRQRIFHIWVLLLGSACIPSGILAQTIPEITEPDNTYRRYYKDQHFDEHRLNQHQPLGDSIFTVLGRWAWGYCLAVDTKDNCAFIGNGPTFQALDITNPSLPTIVGEYIVTDRINDIVIRGNLAYLAMAQGLVVMDIADPTHPQQLGELYLSGIPQQLVVEDSMAYVLSYFTGQMHVVDVSNPAQPVRRSGFGSGEFAYCIAVRSRHVYLGIPNVPAGVLRIVNATNPDALSYRDTTMGFIGRTAATADTLLLIGATPRVGPSRALKIFSIADPAYPRQIGEVVVPGSSSRTGGICVAGTKAYLAVLDTGVVEVDISDPTQPLLQRVLNRKPLFAAAGFKSVSGVGLASLGNHLFVAYYTGLLTINKTQPDSLREVNFLPTGGYMHDVTTHNDRAYVACGLAGLWVLDVSRPANIQAVANIQNGSYIQRVLVSDSLSFLVATPTGSSDSTRGLWIATNPAAGIPSILSHHIGIVRFTSPAQINSISRTGNLLFLTQGGEYFNDSTLEVIDVSDPTNPTQLSALRGGYSPWDIAVRDSILYIATPDSGIIIVDAHLPDQPMRVGRDTHGSYCLAVEDTLLFTISGVDSFLVFSSSVPSLLRRLGGIRLTTPNVFDERLAAVPGYVYVTRGEVGLIDVRNPTTPIERGTSPYFSNATSVTAFNNIIVASDVVGLWVLRNRLMTGIKDVQPNQVVTAPELFQNYPNPFNPTTLIRFHLPKADQIRLEIFDLLGRVVGIPLNNHMQEGEYSVSLDGSRFPSGVYFYRLTSSQGSLTRRMLLIK